MNPQPQPQSQPVVVRNSLAPCSSNPTMASHPATISRARTTLNMVRCEQIWTIETFSQADIAHLESPNKIVTLKSPNFYNATNPSLQFCIKLYPREYNETFKDYVSVFVHWDVAFTDETVQKLPIGYKFSIINDKGQRCNAQFSRCKFNQANLKGYGLPGFIKRDQLTLPSNGYLPNDTLTIYCEVTYVMNTNLTEDVSHIIDAVHSVNPRFEALADQSPKKLCAEMADAWLSPMGRQSSDVVLVVGRKQMHVHKLILMHHSSVWAALFAADMKEKRDNRIEMIDISWEVLNELMRYIYTGKVEKMDLYAEELMAAAEKYDIQHLKALCEEALCKTVNEQNATNLLHVADMHNAPKLRERAFQYSRNYEANYLKQLPLHEFTEVVHMIRMKRKAEEKPIITVPAPAEAPTSSDDESAVILLPSPAPKRPKTTSKARKAPEPSQRRSLRSTSRKQ